MADTIGCLIADVAGLTLTGEDRELLTHPLIGGVILFARNYENKAQLQGLCQQIRASRQKPLLIMVDQEGGRVQRFIQDFTRLPYMGQIGESYDQDPLKALQFATDCGWIMATELLAMGIDLSLAPILDLNKGVNTVIAKRAFHANPQVVIALAKAFMYGMQTAGMCSVGKHFPGHGSVNKDSHISTPVDERSLESVEKDDLVTFSAMISAGIAGIMTSHIVFPQVDKHAVGYSSQWIKKILIEQYGFSGTILSDDLNMEGANISSNYAERVQMARQAGIDLTLVCNNRSGVVQVLDQLNKVQHQVACDKWQRLQGQFVNVQKNINSSRWQQIHQQLQSMN